MRPGAQGRSSIHFLIWLLVLLPACRVEARMPVGDLRLGRPGFLVIAGARDSLMGFRWQSGPGPQQRSLVWGDGQLVLPDSMALVEYSQEDWGLPVGEELGGSSAGGSFLFSDGIFLVSEPLLLTDGRISLYTVAGEIEVRGPQILYRRPPPKADGAEDPRAGFLFLAGIALLVVVLMRRVGIYRRGKQAG